MPETDTDLVHHVTCSNCGRRYDAMAAAWCNCISRDRSLLCPSCGTCFCSASPSFKSMFWERAPAELWIRRHEMKRPKTAWSNPDPTEAKRPLVMVVDDDRSMRMILVAGITQNGYGVVTAEDGVEGLRIARLYRPDLILTDALMPKMDGREMARHVRETLPHAAIVVMTSVYRSAQQKYEALRDFGADDYLVKPIHARVLADLLGRYLKRE